MISHPSESCEEGEVVACIKAEMESLGYDEVKVDGLGNVMGFMGEGDKIIAIDSHIDTVGIGNIENWTHDPYQGYETDDIIYGRGGSDQEGGMAAAAYGVKIMKDLDLLPKGYKMMVVGSVQEEDCDGMCWQSIVNEYFNGPEDARSKIDQIGVVNGLAWTEVGGELLEVEAGVMDGTGKLELTGNLGQVMQESVQAAYTAESGFIVHDHVSVPEYGRLRRIRAPGFLSVDSS